MLGPVFPPLNRNRAQIFPASGVLPEFTSSSSSSGRGAFLAFFSFLACLFAVQARCQAVFFPTGARASIDPNVVGRDGAARTWSHRTPRWSSARRARWQRLSRVSKTGSTMDLPYRQSARRRAAPRPASSGLRPWSNDHLGSPATASTPRSAPSSLSSFDQNSLLVRFLRFIRMSRMRSTGGLMRSSRLPPCRHDFFALVAMADVMGSGRFIVPCHIRSEFIQYHSHRIIVQRAAVRRHRRSPAVSARESAPDFPFLASLPIRTHASGIGSAPYPLVNLLRLLGLQPEQLLAEPGSSCCR